MDSQHVSEIILNIVNALIIPILPVISAYLIALIKRKTAEIENRISNKELSKYIDIVENAIITAVTAVNQTYVDELTKNDDSLTPDQQKEAFKMAKSKVIGILGDASTGILRQIYGDFDTWVDNRIEYYVKQSKINPRALNPIRVRI